MISNVVAQNQDFASFTDKDGFSVLYYLDSSSPLKSAVNQLQSIGYQKIMPATHSVSKDGAWSTYGVNGSNKTALVIMGVDSTDALHNLTVAALHKKGFNVLVFDGQTGGDTSKEEIISKIQAFNQLHKHTLDLVITEAHGVITTKTTITQLLSGAINSESKQEEGVGIGIDSNGNMPSDEFFETLVKGNVMQDGNPHPIDIFLTSCYGQRVVEGAKKILPAGSTLVTLAEEQIVLDKKVTINTKDGNVLNMISNLNKRFDITDVNNAVLLKLYLDNPQSLIGSPTYTKILSSGHAISESIITSSVNLNDIFNDPIKLKKVIANTCLQDSKNEETSVSCGTRIFEAVNKLKVDGADLHYLSNLRAVLPDKEGVPIMLSHSEKEALVKYSSAMNLKFSLILEEFSQQEMQTIGLEEF